MGCANSKQKRCRHCNAPYSPIPRSYSMHVHHHHPPHIEDDTNHVVALTSTTLGSINLNSSVPNKNKVADNVVSHSESCRFEKSSTMDSEKKVKEEFSMGLIEAKTWSNMIEQKLPEVIPKTPIRTPPGEPETIINTWELMEGLEDTISPFRSPNWIRSFSFDLNSGVDPPLQSNFTEKNNGISSPPKPRWLHMTEERESDIKSAMVSDFDREVISSFRKSLQELDDGEEEKNEREDMVRKLGFWFEEKKSNDDDDDVVVLDFKNASCVKDKVILYFTSLRGVRKTYEDCCQVRLILKGLGIRVVERDVSMHSGFKEELKELLGDGFGRGGLPRVFVGRKYIGGVEEMQKLHEDGKLEKLFDSCEKIYECFQNDGGGVCETCGDIRFVPCETCSGSCKIYYEGDDEKNEDEGYGGEMGKYGFQRCPDCNENGLIHCPVCCY